MYGLINKSLRGMVIEEFGEASWQEILDASGVPDDSFLTMRSYDDQLTYALVAAASEKLEVPAADCLEMFGGYWVHKVATRDFQSLMAATGSSTIHFLRNLNSLHDRISTTFLEYVPPEFQVEELEQPSRYRIHYLSTREGMVPFVTGLLNALAEHFGDTMVIDADEALPAKTGTHHAFEVSFH